MTLKPIAGRVPVVKQVDFEGQPHHGLWYVIDANDPTCMKHLRTDGKWHNGTGSHEEGYWPTEAAALAFARECAEREEVCHCGMLMNDHHQGSSCTTPRSMGAPPDPLTVTLRPDVVERAEREAGVSDHRANAATHGPIEPCGPDGELGMCSVCGAAEVEIELYSCQEFQERKNANDS